MSEEVNSAEFQVPASDAKGHSVAQYFRMAGGLLYQLDIILNSKKFPYKTKGELYRHAVVRHLKWLLSLEPVRNVMSVAEAVMNILRREENNDMFAAIFEKLETRISVYLGSGEEGEAIRVIREIQDTLSEMEDGYWKNKYLGELEKRHGRLLKSAEKADLAGGMEDGE